MNTGGMPFSVSSSPLHAERTKRLIIKRDKYLTIDALVENVNKCKNSLIVIIELILFVHFHVYFNPLNEF